MLLFFPLISWSQLSAEIHLKDGRIIDVYHLGQMGYGKKVDADFEKYAILIKGNYFSQEMKFYRTGEYNKFREITLQGFSKEAGECPDQKGAILLQRKNGKQFKLTDCIITNGKTHYLKECNSIVVAMRNPVTDQIHETSIPLKDINYIILAKNKPVQQKDTIKSEADSL